MLVVVRAGYGFGKVVKVVVVMVGLVVGSGWWVIRDSGVSGRGGGGVLGELVGRAVGDRGDGGESWVKG